MKSVRVTWIKSTIGCKQSHRRTMEALGLKHMGHSVVKELNPAIKGMIDSVYFLVRVEEVA
ncbi:MAG: large subunit ribosomal protein [Candidatus Sumerlaeota bacterium]|nr:large subunit ribosomal protein [Candidatus Sumerlaeota bacterium]